jgi:hypothetical protein
MVNFQNGNGAKKGATAKSLYGLFIGNSQNIALYCQIAGGSNHYNSMRFVVVIMFSDWL